jgi:hypothetical protein
MAERRRSNQKKTRRKPVANGAATGVTVRMFCQGLGDCFLITFPQGDARPYVILIDCGVAIRSVGEAELMRQVANKIVELTKTDDSKKSIVDLLVVTHEHYDHVCGFVHAEKELSEIEFKQVWYAWTEDRNDDLANQLRDKHARDKTALARALGAVSAIRGSVREKLIQALRGVSAFYEPVPAAKKKKVDVAAAMAAAGTLQKSGEPATLMSGKVLRLPGTAVGGVADGVEAFVLGPPHDARTLRLINPHKKNPETYEKSSVHAEISFLGMNWGWIAAMNTHAPRLDIGIDEENAQVERAMPFDEKWRRNLASAEKSKDPFFRQHYFASDPQRRIDGDWLLSGAQQLALYMESYTNNTSLALAFELPNSKKILLFAADAQVGSWLSWHDMTYKTRDKRRLQMHDLLANTVLYKVGHHGSHNATLREKGLEMMNHPELVAMLPVEATAVERLGYGEMPLGALVKELEKRTSGRLLRLDKKWPNGRAPGTWRKSMMKPRLAQETFTDGADGRALYMEYTIKDE